jgi:hypothetical protein
MSTVDPHEIYLLETFSSAGYLAELRDTWGEMIQHLEQSLDRFMTKRPAQADAVWGDRVLPNFRSTYDALCAGVIALSHGDPDGLYSANRPNNDYIGQRDYSDAWLSSDARERYRQLLDTAARMAGNICATVETYWEPGNFNDFQKHFGPIDMPPVLPAYRLNAAVTVRTDAPVARTGVYLSDKENSIAAFVTTGRPAPSATVVVGIEDLLDEQGVKYGEQAETEDQPCLWTLVERAMR